MKETLILVIADRQDEKRKVFIHQPIQVADYE